MTVIVAVKDKKGIVVGADTLAVITTGSKQRFVESKIFQKDELTIGFAGSIRAAQFIKHNYEFPKREEEASDLSYLVQCVASSLHELTQEYFSISHNENMPNIPLSLLVIYRGNMYEILEDFTVMEIADDFGCVGSGAVYAKGSLYSTAGTKMPTTERIELAIKAACHFDLYCGLPSEIKAIE